MSKYTRADREFSIKFRKSDRWVNLRKEVKERAEQHSRKQRAIERAEEADTQWELIKLGCTPIRQGRLFK